MAGLLSGCWAPEGAHRAISGVSHLGVRSGVASGSIDPRATGQPRMAGIASDRRLKGSALGGAAAPSSPCARRSARRRGCHRAAGQAALLQVALVVLLGPVEVRGGRDLGYHRLAVSGLLALPGGQGGGLLLGRVEEDRRAVLRTAVGTLAVELRGVVELPEHDEQLVVGDPLGVELDLDDLRVAGAPRAHLLVARVLERAAEVADGGADHAGRVGELDFDLPEEPGYEWQHLDHAAAFDASGRPSVAFTVLAFP